MASDKSVNNYDTNCIGESSGFDDYSNIDPTNYFRDMNLRHFAAEPCKMLTQHVKLKEECLKYNNPDAHYIEGILQYFVHKHHSKGLFHLRQSAILNNCNGILLYGLIMLANGQYHKGKKYLDKIEWKDNMTTSDQCWERVKNSLTSVPAFIDQSHYIEMVNLKPQRKCHPKNGSEACEACYHYKRLRQFVKLGLEK